jgi:protein phosphatase
MGVKIDLTHQQVRRGDTLVLCSDGLSGQLNKDEIAQIVNADPDLMNACKALIDRANAKGGPDNITVIVARFEGSGLRPPHEDDQVAHRVYPLLETGQTAVVAPNDGIDRYAPTEEIPSLSRKAAMADVDERERITLEIAETPVVSDARRRAGRSIAIILMVVLVIGALWFLYHAAPKR